MPKLRTKPIREAELELELVATAEMWLPWLQFKMFSTVKSFNFSTYTAHVHRDGTKSLVQPSLVQLPHSPIGHRGCLQKKLIKKQNGEAWNNLYWKNKQTQRKKMH